MTFAIRISLYLALMLLITWNKYPLKSINDMILLYSKTYNTAYDIDLFLYSIFSFLIIFFPFTLEALRDKVFLIERKGDLLKIIFLNSFPVMKNFFRSSKRFQKFIKLLME